MPLELAVKVTVPPVDVATGSTGTVTTSGAAPDTAQLKLTVAALTPSLTAATTLKLPAVVGVPVMAPVLGLTATPGGRPVAL